MTTTLPEKVKNPIMMLITKAEMKKLTEAPYENMTPIIKLFGGPLTWLVTHIDEEGVLYGYADLNQGCVEFGGLCRIEQLPTMKCGIGFLERDRYFKHVPGTKYLELETLAGI